MIGRDELFALAAQPIGSPSLQREADSALARQMKPSLEVVAVAKRANKVWLPAGKKSANTTLARDVERDLLARNYDIEDAIAEAGGRRGEVGRA
jgi:hypothetical protein